MLKSSVKKISRYWKFLCAFAGIIFLINIVYLVSQINRNKPPHATMRDPSTAELHARKTISRRGADPSHIIYKLVNSSSLVQTPVITDSMTFILLPNIISPFSANELILTHCEFQF